MPAVRPRREHHIPRPRNAFIVFRSHYIKANPAHAEFQQNELSKIAANVWNNMDPDQRKPYADEARAEKERHKTMYPDYVYRAPSAATPKPKPFKIKVKTGNPSQKDVEQPAFAVDLTPRSQPTPLSSPFGITDPSFTVPDFDPFPDQLFLPTPPYPSASSSAFDFNVPDFNFELDEEFISRCSLAAWAGYE